MKRMQRIELEKLMQCVVFLHTIDNVRQENQVKHHHLKQAPILYIMFHEFCIWNEKCSRNVQENSLKERWKVNSQYVYSDSYLSSAISATIIGITTNTAPPAKPAKNRDA